jgi:hypothetical protein
MNQIIEANPTQEKFIPVPIGAYATIQWNDEPNETHEGYYFSFDEGMEENEDGITVDCYGVPDEQIFFSCSGVKDMESFLTKGSADFTVISYQVEYQIQE